MISVVIPLYNKARHIRRALDSVLAQTYQDFELIVVDDGSTDGGADVVAAYDDRRIRLTRQENQGECAARNRGIAEARADLVAFLDADDEWLPEHLATVTRLAEEYPQCGAHATAYERVDAQHRRTTPKFKDVPEPPWEGIIPNYFRSALSGPVWSSAVAIPERVFGSVGLFPVGVRRGGDLDMWCRIALKYQISFSTRVGAVYHQEADNRACIQYPIPPLSKHPLTKLIGDALESGNLPPGVTPNDIVEYRNWRLTAIADALATAGNAAGAREYLRVTASTRRHRIRWVRAWLLAFVPRSTRAALRQVRHGRGR